MFQSTLSQQVFIPLIFKLIHNTTLLIWQTVTLNWNFNNGSIANALGLLCVTVGGAVASWLVRSSPDTALSMLDTKLIQLQFARERTEETIQSKRYDKIERQIKALKEMSGKADQLKRTLKG